jgi:hypothetical protein
VGFQQRLHFVAQILVTTARLVQKSVAVPKRNLNSFSKDSYVTACIVVHRILKSFPWMARASKPVNIFSVISLPSPVRAKFKFILFNGLSTAFNKAAYRAH